MEVTLLEHNRPAKTLLLQSNVLVLFCFMSPSPGRIGRNIMAKRRIKFKLGEIRISGVELEIEDERDQATAALSALQNQLSGVVQPAVSKALLGASQVIESQPVNGSAAAPSQRKRRKLGASSV